MPMNHPQRILNIMARLGVGIAAAATGALAAVAVQVAGRMLVGLPMAYFPWLVVGFAVVGFFCGVIVGGRKVGASPRTPDFQEEHRPSVPSQDGGIQSGNPYASPSMAEAPSRSGQRTTTAYLHAACDGCAWFLVVSVISAVAVFFIAGWPGVGASPAGCGLRVLVVLLAAIVPAVLAVIASLSMAKSR